jgi:hypothetical protein
VWSRGRGRPRRSAPALKGEADLIGVLAHDLGDQRSLGDLLTDIPTIGEDALDEGE